MSFIFMLRVKPIGTIFTKPILYMFALGLANNTSMFLIRAQCSFQTSALTLVRHLKKSGHSFNGSIFEFLTVIHRLSSVERL